jgi:hypothetical protein
MKTLEIGKATGSLAQYAKSVGKGPVIVTRGGKTAGSFDAHRKYGCGNCHVEHTSAILSVN